MSLTESACPNTVGLGQQLPHFFPIPILSTPVTDKLKEETGTFYMGKAPPRQTEASSDPAYNYPHLQGVPILHSTPPCPKGEESCSKAQPKPLPHG